MDFEYSPKVEGAAAKKSKNFMDEYIYPNEKNLCNEQLNSQGDRWQIPPISGRTQAKGQGPKSMEPVPA